jgi:3-dehydroquinate synthase
MKQEINTMNYFHVTLPAESPCDYPIVVGADFHEILSHLPEGRVFTKCVIITDDTLKTLYGNTLLTHLQHAGQDAILFSVPAGEHSKNVATYQHLIQGLVEAGCERGCVILALGGGVVGDLAGFLAGTYLRGVPYVQMPTSLLAMVDSSVGGKTGINIPQGKNLIGMVHQPLLVLTDVALLKTLPPEHLINGLIEAIKVFLIADYDSLLFVEAELEGILSGDTRLLQDVVARALAIKIGVVSRDEKERGERALLNFGHTVGHALEKVSDYTVLHGIAVGYGILVEARIAQILGVLTVEHLQAIDAIMARLGLHGHFLQQYDISEVIAATKNDKKVRSGCVQYVILQSLGKALIENNRYVHPVSDTVVQQAYSECVGA